MWGIWSEFERNKTIVLGIFILNDASINTRWILSQWLLLSHSLMFPPSRQTRPEKGELKVITIRHHKIVLRGVAHIKLVFWIAFLWKFKHCIPQLLKVFLYWPSKSLCPCVFGWSLWILHSIVIFLTQVFKLSSQLSLSSIIHFIILRA